MVLIIFSSNSFALTKVNILDFKNEELDIIVNMDTKNSTFSEYYSFQYEEGLDFSFLANYNNFYLINHSDRVLTLKCDNDTIYLQIFGNNDKHHYVGYGLSRRTANKYQLSLKSNPASIIDLITVNGKAAIKSSTKACDSSD